MRPSFSALLVGGLLFVIGACGDDDVTPPQADSQVKQDTAGTTQDTGGTTQDTGGTTQDTGGTTKDTGGVTPDAKTSNLNCAEIGLCSEACGKKCTGTIKFACLMKCQTDCAALGCASSKTPYTALSTCVQSKCLMDCINGPTTACATCVTTKCAAENTTCNAHKC